MLQLLSPHTGEHRESTQAALSAHCSSLVHSGTGGAGVAMITRSQRTSAKPVYPGGQVQTALCLIPVHNAFKPQAFTHGSAHFLLMHARSPGQSSLTMHSGYVQIPKRHVPWGPHGLGSQGSSCVVGSKNKYKYNVSIIIFLNTTNRLISKLIMRKCSFC